LKEIQLDGPTATSASQDAEPLRIPTRYDGPDLEEVSRQLGVSPAEVVSRHTGQLWTVEFAGFAPGFGYLTGDDGGLEVTRRDSPRVRIPAGSVGLAGPYTGVYPRPSPGGWQLIGRTDEVMWDVTRDPPALLSPGTRVKFVRARHAHSAPTTGTVEVT
jgi:KipI family sensor histidine kinase inhibitor